MSNQTEEIVVKNREQLLEGKTSEGKKITPKYATKRYAAFKKALNAKPGTGTPDLKVTGDFHSSIKLVKKQSDFVFKTDLGYAKKYIVPKYDKIFGLYPENQKQFNEQVFLPEYVDKIKKHLQI